MESLIERLRSLAKAYPKDVFPVLTKEQTWAHPEIVARAGASMGRHFSTTFTEAADEIERLRKDAERYRWLRENAGAWEVSRDYGEWTNCETGEKFKPRVYFAAFGTGYCGMRLDDAIDAAMNGANSQVQP